MTDDAVDAVFTAAERLRATGLDYRVEVLDGVDRITVSSTGWEPAT